MFNRFKNKTFNKKTQKIFRVELCQASKISRFCQELTTIPLKKEFAFTAATLYHSIFLLKIVSVNFRKLNFSLTFKK